MKISQKTYTPQAFGALICDSTDADTRQKKLISTLTIDRTYFSRSLLRNMQLNDIDIFVRPTQKSNLSILLKQNVGKNWFVPVDNNGEFMIETFDSDDVSVLDCIKKYAKKCENFMQERMFNNTKNKKKKSDYLNFIA